MAAFLTVSTIDGQIVINTDEIVSVTADDKYHPNQCARILLKSGRSIKTDHRHSVASLSIELARA
jgi:hypothetical protein